MHAFKGPLALTQQAMQLANSPPRSSCKAMANRLSGRSHQPPKPAWSETPSRAVWCGATGGTRMMVAPASAAGATQIPRWPLWIRRGAPPGKASPLRQSASKARMVPLTRNYTTVPIAVRTACGRQPLAVAAARATYLVAGPMPPLCPTRGWAIPEYTIDRLLRLL